MTAIQRPIPVRHRLTGRQGRLAGLSALVVAIMAAAVIGAVVLARDDSSGATIAPEVVRPSAVQPAPVAPANIHTAMFAYIVRSQADADILTAQLAEADVTTGSVNPAPATSTVYVATSDEVARSLTDQLYGDANMVGLPLQVVDLRNN